MYLWRYTSVEGFHINASKSLINELIDTSKFGPFIHYRAANEYVELDITDGRDPIKEPDLELGIGWSSKLVCGSEGLLDTNDDLFAKFMSEKAAEDALKLRENKIVQTIINNKSLAHMNACIDISVADKNITIDADVLQICFNKDIRYMKSGVPVATIGTLVPEASVLYPNGEITLKYEKNQHQDNDKFPHIEVHCLCNPYTIMEVSYRLDFSQIESAPNMLIISAPQYCDWSMLKLTKGLDGKIEIGKPKTPHTRKPFITPSGWNSKVGVHTPIDANPLDEKYYRFFKHHDKPVDTFEGSTKIKGSLPLWVLNRQMMPYNLNQLLLPLSGWCDSLSLGGNKVYHYCYPYGFTILDDDEKADVSKRNTQQNENAKQIIDNRIKQNLDIHFYEYTSKGDDDFSTYAQNVYISAGPIKEADLTEIEDMDNVFVISEKHLHVVDVLDVEVNPVSLPAAIPTFYSADNVMPPELAKEMSSHVRSDINAFPRKPLPSFGLHINIVDGPDCLIESTGSYKAATVNIFFYCDNRPGTDSRGTITALREIEYCSYSVWIATPLVCAHPDLAPPIIGVSKEPSNVSSRSEEGSAISRRWPCRIVHPEGQIQLEGKGQGEGEADGDRAGHSQEVTGSTSTPYERGGPYVDDLGGVHTDKTQSGNQIICHFTIPINWIHGSVSILEMQELRDLRREWSLGPYYSREVFGLFTDELPVDDSVTVRGDFVILKRGAKDDIYIILNRTPNAREIDINDLSIRLMTYPNLLGQYRAMNAETYLQMPHVLIYRLGAAGGGQCNSKIDSENGPIMWPSKSAIIETNLSEIRQEIGGRLFYVPEAMIERTVVDAEFCSKGLRWLEKGLMFTSYYLTLSSCNSESVKFDIIRYDYQGDRGYVDRP